MRVHNLNGISQDNCSCGSWLQHWKNYSGTPIPSECVEETCTREPEVGAHVQIDVSSINWYIIPLCSRCNKRAGDLNIMDSTVLVPANKGETCERKTASAARYATYSARL